MEFEFEHFKNANEAIDWIIKKIIKNDNTEKAFEAWDFIDYLYDLAQYYED